MKDPVVVSSYGVTQKRVDIIFMHTSGGLVTLTGGSSNTAIGTLIVVGGNSNFAVGSCVTITGGIR